MYYQNQDSFTRIVGIVSVVVGMGFVFAYPFIATGITQLGILLVKGQQGFYNTFKPMTYSMTIGAVYGLFQTITLTLLYATVGVPYFGSTQDIVQLIPFYVIVGVTSIAATAHILAVSIIGVAHFQKISRARAAVAGILIPLGLLMLLVVIMIVVVIAFALMIGYS